MTPEIDRDIGTYEGLAYARAARDHATGFQRGLWFDDDAALKAIRFFESELKHHKGEWNGDPFILSDWQTFIVGEIFGWKRADGTRRFREAYVEVPRKNGKSDLAAGVGNYLTFADGEPEAEVYSSATKKDQARIVWASARRQVQLSPLLNRNAKLYQLSIFDKVSHSRFEPLAADHNSMDGLNPHGNILDELHAHKTREVYDVLDTAMGARRQPLTFIITTAGLYNPESIGFQKHMAAIQILEGAYEADDQFCFIACADPDDDFDDPRVWAKANPNFGISVKPDYIEAQVQKAHREPSAYNTLARLHFGLWTATASRWLTQDDWNLCNLEADDADLEGVLCYGALDLSTTTDLTALVLAFPDDAGFYDLKCWFWCPEDSILQRSRRDRVPYDAWAREGYIIPTPGNVVDYNMLRLKLKELSLIYDIRRIAYDPWNAQGLVNDLMSDGFDMVPARQGFVSMSGPSKEFERLVKSAHLAHGGNPVLKWMASNVVLTRDSADNIKPAKDKSIGRIDGIVAAIMAVDQAQRTDDTIIYDGELMVVG